MRQMREESSVYLCDEHHHWVNVGSVRRDCPECRKVRT